MVFVCEKIGKNTAFCFRKMYLKEVKGESHEYIHRFQLFPVYLLFLCVVFPFSFFFISLRHFFRYAHAYWQGRGNLIQFPPVAFG